MSTPDPLAPFVTPIRSLLEPATGQTTFRLSPERQREVNRRLRALQDHRARALHESKSYIVHGGSS